MGGNQSIFSEFYSNEALIYRLRAFLERTYFGSRARAIDPKMKMFNSKKEDCALCVHSTHKLQYYCFNLRLDLIVNIDMPERTNKSRGVATVIYHKSGVHRSFIENTCSIHYNPKQRFYY